MTKFATHPAVHLAVHNLRTKNQTLTLKSCQKQNQIRPHHPAAALECILLSKFENPTAKKQTLPSKSCQKQKIHPQHPAEYRENALATLEWFNA